MIHTVYKLREDEFHRYKTHLISLDQESRYMRFGFYIKDETIENLCSEWELNSHNHIIFAIENNNLEVVAVAHISLENEVPELAFSVLKEYQGKGMGDVLMKRAIEYCQNRNIEQGFMICLASNLKIKHLARKNGVLVTTESGESYGEVSIPEPTPISYWHEYVEDSVGKLDHLGKAQRKFAQMFRFPLCF